MFRLRAPAATGWKMISSGKVSFVGWMYVRGLNTEGLESLWLKTSAAWGWRQERSIL
jgi:hypothetical protein